MLAAKREFCINGTRFKTPMLVPSFSSKGFADVATITKSFSDALGDSPFLISAFDIAHNKVKVPVIAGQLIFVDSGGYEKGGVVDLTDPINRHTDVSDKDWTVHKHKQTIESHWNATKRLTVLVTYDNANTNSKSDFGESNQIPQFLSRCCNRLSCKAYTRFGRRSCGVL